jgi:hypothetical protein
LQRLLDQLTDTPAFIVGRYLDILAWNGLAAALLADVDKLPPRERNYLRMVFTNQRVQDLYDDWEAMARTGVAILRRQAADNPTDPRLAALVGELSVVSAQFRQWRAARHVTHPDFGTKTIRHPELGDLTLDWDAFTYIGDPDQQLVLWSAEPGSSSHEKLRILSSWNAPPAVTREAPAQDR